MMKFIRWPRSMMRRCISKENSHRGLLMLMAGHFTMTFSNDISVRIWIHGIHDTRNTSSIFTRDPFHYHSLIWTNLNASMDSNHTPSKVWAESIYPLRNFIGALWEWISYFISNFAMDLCSKSRLNMLGLVAMQKNPSEITAQMK